METDILYTSYKKLVTEEAQYRKLRLRTTVLYSLVFLLVVWNYLPMIDAVPGVVNVPLGKLSFFLIPIPVLIVAIFLTHRKRRSAKKIKAMRSLN